MHDVQARPGFHEIDAEIHRVLREEPSSTTMEIVAATGLPVERVTARLQAGKEKGILNSREHARGARREYAWWLTGSGL